MGVVLSKPGDKDTLVQCSPGMDTARLVRVNPACCLVHTCQDHLREKDRQPPHKHCQCWVRHSPSGTWCTGHAQTISWPKVDLCNESAGCCAVGQVALPSFPVLWQEASLHSFDVLVSHWSRHVGTLSNTMVVMKPHEQQHHCPSNLRATSVLQSALLN